MNRRGPRKGTKEKYLKVLQRLYEKRNLAKVKVKDILRDAKADLLIEQIVKQLGYVNEYGKWLLDRGPTFADVELIVEKRSDMNKGRCRKNKGAGQKLNELDVKTMQLKLWDLYAEFEGEGSSATASHMAEVYTGNKRVGVLLEKEKILIRENNKTKWVASTPNKNMAIKVIEGIKALVKEEESRNKNIVGNKNRDELMVEILHMLQKTYRKVERLEQELL